MPRLAVALFNLGGPDSMEAVRPFLFNLFSDPAIVNMPGPIRRLLAWLISIRRAHIAQATYSRIGGCSPLLSETNLQARALEAVLVDSGLETRVFPAMRYWHPLISEAVETIKHWHPDQVVILPLYPQFSNMTTGSSIKEWIRAAGSLRVVTTAVCCWPAEYGWITAITELTLKGLDTARTICAVHSIAKQQPRILFSAHSLPESIIARGDPYQRHVEKTVSAIVVALKESNIDYEICYQSRVGPQRWIGPTIDNAILRAGVGSVPIVLVPVTFVSEHVETLVELDIKYRQLAETVGVPVYVRVPTVGVHTHFVAGLARLVYEAIDSRTKVSIYQS